MFNPSGPSLDPLRFPQRKPVRLKGHDYSSGIYFITICVWQRRPLLSRVARGRICLTPAGQIVEDEWLRTNQIRCNAWVDAFVVMPNHFHGIVGLGQGSGFPAHGVDPDDRADGADPDDRAHGSDPESRAHGADPDDRAHGSDPESRAHAVRPYLGRFVAGFKSACTRRYRDMAGDAADALWQRGYYERVIRTQRALEATRRYIANNPRGKEVEHRDSFFNTRLHASE
jgi:REP element-mobilizing transposase RayT